MSLNDLDLVIEECIIIESGAIELMILYTTIIIGHPYTLQKKFYQMFISLFQI